MTSALAYLSGGDASVCIRDARGLITLKKNFFCWIQFKVWVLISSYFSNLRFQFFSLSWVSVNMLSMSCHVPMKFHYGNTANPFATAYVDN